MHKLVFCLQSCGEETEQSCLNAFFEGAPGYTLYEVRNVTPAVAALNKMIEVCDGSTYFVPLDSDMVLYPGFIDRIEQAIKSPGNWHSVLFPLWDTLTQAKIMALKVFCTEIIRQFPFVDRPCPDVQHYKDLTSAGYTTVNLMHEEPIGDHVVKGNYFCYAKYRDAYNVLQAYPDDALESHFKGGNSLKTYAEYHFKFFSRRYRETGNDDYLYCIAGMVESLTMPRTDCSKDLGDQEMRIPVGNAKKLFRLWQGVRYFS